MVPDYFAEKPFERLGRVEVIITIFYITFDCL